MRPPCEQNLRYLIPQFRSHLAVKLKKAGWSQIQIAEGLGITQAAISGYLKLFKKKTPYTTKIFKDIVSEVAKGLIENTLPPNELVAYTCQLCLAQRIGGPLCSQHKRDIPSLKKINCRVCYDFPPSQAKITSNLRASVLTELTDAFNLLQAEPKLAILLPEVRSNLIFSIPHAKSLDDIAGFPGRITRIHNRIAVLTQPEFGGSTYTGKLLLTIQGTYSNLRTAFCLRSDPAILDFLKKQKIPVTTLTLQTKNQENSLLLNSLKSLPKKDMQGPVLAVHSTGLVGYESIIYVFGESPHKLANIIMSLLKTLP